ncbi:tetratricopeptide repeat domain-containing protein [Neohortaea acidophila]|uniref:Tetratricopeptide repeat domain-containing protein n=1 Tax=Neohortaea acidophila TaxID=245834 RepID=A0A6A6PMI0_9PEZI|nr:tetratricopeptide repeat domain-containing protein [Neohortaea acidophila]KAF2480901.1 tetratricopeptide repeat domain-containing protein [Neohortaea acidophila]
MDVFSAVVTAASLADITIRLIKYLRDVKQAAEDVDEEIDSLIREVESLQVVHTQIQEEYERHVQDAALDSKENILWFHTGKTLQETRQLAVKLEICVREIYGENPHTKGPIDGLRKANRKRSRDSRLVDIRNQIHTNQNCLQLWFSIISSVVGSARQEDTTERLKEINSTVMEIAELIDSGELLASQNSSLQQLPSHRDLSKASVAALSSIVASATFVEQSLSRENVNRHFDTPQLVDRFYTGREQEAKQLESWLLQSNSKSSNTKQRRFVVLGVGGSGKTQFCCKFADDNRARFWGVFWVDARSHELLKQTFSQNVAQYGGVGANANAALHWLSNLEEAWLLIIDNADDPEVKLDEYLPKGSRGHVLITTRNPANKSYGNVGPGYYEFQGLQDGAASSLLLKAAGRSPPWDTKITNWANQISSALGYLALAIAVAGSAIREGFCQFHDYLDWHEEQRRQRPGRASSPTPGRDGNIDDPQPGSVEATFDISYKAIADRGTQESADALQLLKTFAFLHCENIRFAFLERAVVNAAAEAEQQKNDIKKMNELKRFARRQNWSQWCNARLLLVLTYLNRNRSPPVLPTVLRDGRREGRFSKSRVRAALRQLTQCSLLIHNDQKDTYSMHPLVHEWAREAPDTTFGEQVVWCEAAAMLLSCCVLLPPLGTTTEDERILTQLLPHVDHVRSRQAQIEQWIRDKRMARMKPLPIFESGFNRDRALMYAKFSVVYAYNTRFEDAKKLQIPLKDFLLKVAGLQSPVTRRVHLALAGTLLQLGEGDEASKLQESVIQSCIGALGLEHRDTLAAKLSLSETRFNQGQFSDARNLQQEVVDGFQRILGAEHEETLNAMDYLGRTVKFFFRDEDRRQARQLHLAAIAGFRKIYGDDNNKTLTAYENLGALAAWSGERTELEEANVTMERVLDIRRTKLGKEHGYTLMAMAGLALVKKGLGQLSEAETLIGEAIAIAERNFGAAHYGCLFGRYRLAQIWAAQGRLAEAERQLVQVTDWQKRKLQGRGSNHPDRIAALVELAAVYNALGKHDECERTADEALHALDTISTQEHPFATKLKADRERWRQQRAEMPGEVQQETQTETQQILLPV